MNIKILDSWLRENLKTEATASQIAQKLSLTSLSVEKVEKRGADFLYNMEITSNRPDLFSVVGVAREAAAILPRFGINAEFIPPKIKDVYKKNLGFPIKIENNPKLVNRICAVVMDVKIGKSPQVISDRLEASDIRSLNNVIDVTNYVMQYLGHPAHVFDFDRLNTDKLIIREGRRGEKITTLDKKNYMLSGGEIVAADKNNKIVDLLGIMGLENSVVTENTKRILFFIDNNEKTKIRQASMQLGIRTNAAILNEKGVDPNLAIQALLYGIELLQKNAEGKLISDILDIYDNKIKEKKVSVSFKKINKVIGVNIDNKKSKEALETLGFGVKLGKEKMDIIVPSYRINDIYNEEDIIEEISRIYGYFNLPSILPTITVSKKVFNFANKFYFEQRIKNAMKYWGFTETYTYSFVSEDMLDGPTEDAVEIANPLNKDFVYMRKSLVPSLLKVVAENKGIENIKIFEIANIYLKKGKDLPEEIRTFSAVINGEDANFYQAKGIIEQICFDLNIKNLNFRKSEKSILGSSLFINNEYLGEIEVLDNNLVDFEIYFDVLLKYATTKKEYVPFSKYPPIVQDITVATLKNVTTMDIINNIKTQSEIIKEVLLIDEYEKSKTFRIVYQDPKRNLTKKDVLEIRNKIINSLEKSFSAKIR